jgi:hypothetical protein
MDFTDVISRPLEYVQSIIDKKLANSVSEGIDLSSSMVYGEKESMESYLADDMFSRQVPYLNKSSIGQIRNESLVRYRGLVQDIYNEEYYIGMYPKMNTSTGQTTMAVSKYRDYINDYNDGSDVAIGLDSDECRLVSRQPILFVPIPGETPWVDSYVNNENNTTNNNALESEMVQQQPALVRKGSKRQQCEEDHGEAMKEKDNTKSGSDEMDLQVNERVENEKVKSSRLYKDQDSSLTLSSHAIESSLSSSANGAKKDNNQLNPSFYHRLAVSSNTSIANTAVKQCCCIVKMYDLEDQQAFKLNDVYEVVGIYNFEADASATTVFNYNEVDSGLDTEIWPASIAPRLHCITFKRLGSSFPLLIEVQSSDLDNDGKEEKQEENVENMKESSNSGDEDVGTGTSSVKEMRLLRHGIGCSAFSSANISVDGLFRNKNMEHSVFLRNRNRILRAISCALGDDDLAAEYILLATLSRIVFRQGAMLLGSLKVCIGRLSVNDIRIGQLQEVLRQFVPRCVHIDASVQSLNETTFLPKRDYDQNYLYPSPLQLADGTVVLVDETRMMEGTIGETGVGSTKAIRSVLNQQILPIQFGFCDVSIPTDYSCIVLVQSNTCQSILDDGDSAKVPLQKNCKCDWLLANDTNTDAVKDPTVIPEDIFNDEIISSIQYWWAALRQLNVTLDDALSPIAENDFVMARQENEQLEQRDFSRWITIARLIAISLGDSVVTVDHWERMKRMEQLLTLR